MGGSTILCNIVTLILVVPFSRIWTDDNIIYNNALIRRRDVLPLNMARRFYRDEDELSYRRTRDIQDDIIKIQDDIIKARRYEDPDTQWREAKIAENKDQLEKIQRELRWLTLQNENGIGIGL